MMILPSGAKFALRPNRHAQAFERPSVLARAAVTSQTFFRRFADCVTFFEILSAPNEELLIAANETRRSTRARKGIIRRVHRLEASNRTSDRRLQIPSHVGRLVSPGLEEKWDNCPTGQPWKSLTAAPDNRMIIVRS
jgi:hypothetical protein